MNTLRFHRRLRMPRTVYERGQDAVGFWRTAWRAIWAWLVEDFTGR